MKAVKTKFSARNIDKVRKFVRENLSKGYKIGEYRAEDGLQKVIFYFGEKHEAEWVILNLVDPAKIEELSAPFKFFGGANSFRFSKTGRYIQPKYATQKAVIWPTKRVWGNLANWSTEE